MHTLLELFKNMSHSSMLGVVCVIGIFGFLFTMIGLGIFRVKQMLDREKLNFK